MEDLAAIDKIVETVGIVGGTSAVTTFFVKKYFASIEASIKELKDYVLSHHTDIAILKDRQNGKQKFIYKPSQKSRRDR